MWLGFRLHIQKQKRHGPCPRGAHSLAKADSHKYNGKDQGSRKGLVLPGECRAGFPEMQTMEPGRRGGVGVRQMEGRGKRIPSRGNSI